MTEPFDPDKTIIKVGSRPAQISADATVIAEATVLAGQDDTKTLPIGTRIGDCEILSVIGAGGLGIVYLARDHSLGRQVALKEYMPSSLASRGKGLSVGVRSESHAAAFAAGLRSFIDEAHLLTHFDHPSLVKVHRVWEAGGTAYMVMPLYEGPTLKQALRKMGSLPSEAWLTELLRPLLEALQLLHHENCFHRDITPDNIILLKNGQPVLLDFGAARRVIGDMAQNLTVMVKSGFAPIEQYSQDYDPPQGPWTDIYAIGALAYFAIMGKAPPPSTSRVTNDTVVPLAQAASGRYQAGFLHAIDRALQVSPKLRPQSVEELLGLLGWGDSTHITIDPEDGFVPATAPAEQARKKPPVKLIVGAIALATALLVAGTMWLTSPSQQAPTVVQTPSPPAAALPAAVAVPPVTPDVIAPTVVVPEPRAGEQALDALPAAQVAGAASSPLPGSDSAARGAQAEGSSQARTEPGSNNAASAKPPAAVAARASRPRPAEKRPPAPPPPPATVKRPPAPVEPPPVAAVVTPPPVVTAAPSPPPVPPVQPVEPAKAPTMAAISPANSCKSAVLNWICMKEICSKPEFRNHKECVQWRAPAQ